MKTSYIDAYNKHATQNVCLDSLHKSIYCLGGPDINQYVRRLRTMGYTDITSFEKDIDVYENQLEQRPNCKLVHDNILDHLDKNVFYDLDFCGCITSIEPYLSKILKIPDFSLTLSLRPTGYNQTMEIFRKYGEAYFIRYCDTVPMITFFNNKKVNKWQKEK